MKKALGILLIAGLAGCGFHLRQSYEIPDFLEHLTISAQGNSNTTLKPDLVQALQSAGVETSGGEFTLEIVHANLITQTSALATETEVSEITLVFDVEYRLRYHDGRAAIDPRHLLLRRSYQYDPIAVIGKTTEADTLTSELRSDAAQQIVRQLSALQRDKLLPDVDPALLPATT